MILKPLNFPSLTISVILPIIIIHCYSNFINASNQYNFLGSKCPPTGSTFTKGSSYENHLGTLLSFLSSKANETTTNGYFTTNTTILMGGSTIEPIYGSFLCRGDISPEICKGCVALAVTSARSSSNGCMDAKIATNWCDKCMVRSVVADPELFSMDPTHA